MSIVSLEDQEMKSQSPMAQAALRSRQATRRRMAEEPIRVSRSDLGTSRMSNMPDMIVPPFSGYHIPYEADVYIVWRVVGADGKAFSEKPWWAQLLRRFTNWATGPEANTAETQGVFLDEQIAEDFAASMPGGHCQPMPINQMLPIQTVRYKGARCPTSNSKKVREQGNSCVGQLPVVNPAVFRQLQEVRQAAQDVLHSSRSGLNGTSKSASP